MSNIAIKELAWNAGICGRSISGEVRTDWQSIEKFALAIVKQCSTIARDADEGTVHGAGFGYAIATDIEHYFNV